MSDRTAELKAWILDRHTEFDDIPVDADIMEGRLINSLEFVSFLLFVEQLRGTPISADEVDIDSFRTLRRINDVFLSS